MENENMNIPEQNSTPQTNPQPFEPPEWTKNIVVSDKMWELPDENGQPVLSENTVKHVVDEQEENSAHQPSPKKQMPMWKQVALLVIGIIAVVAMLLYAKGVIDKKTETTAAVETTTAVAGTVATTTTTTTTTAQIQSTAPSTKESTTAGTTSSKVVSSSEKSTASESTTEKKKEDKDDKKTSDSSGEIKAEKEIIKYFNDSINRVKPEAVKVVKNFEKRMHNPEKLELPSVIKSIGEKMLDENMTDVNEPVEYATAEEILASFPIANSEKSSLLTADDVRSAVCNDQGSEYEITLILENTVDPEPGKGIAKAVGCINVPAVRDTAPEFITDFSAEYYDCTVRCRADKETGRIVWVNYSTPVLVKLGLDAGFTQFDAQIGLSFEKDYSIVY